jgi:hypothetical protein
MIKMKKQNDMSKKDLIKLGEKYLSEGRIDKAIEVYEKAGFKRGLIKIGNKYLKGELRYGLMKKQDLEEELSGRKRIF